MLRYEIPSSKKAALTHIILVRPTLFSCFLAGLLAILVAESGILIVLKNLVDHKPLDVIDVVILALILVPCLIGSVFLIHLISLTARLSDNGTLTMRSLLMRKVTFHLGQGGLKRVLIRRGKPIQIDLYPAGIKRAMRLRLGMFDEVQADQLVQFVGNVPTDPRPYPRFDAPLIAAVCMFGLALCIKFETPVIYDAVVSLTKLIHA